MKTPLYYYNYIIPLLLAAIFSLKTFRLKWPLAFRYFSIYLWATILVEGLAILWKDFLNLHHTAWWHYSISNGWIYNLYFIPLYTFYTYFFSTILKPLQIKKMVTTLLVSFLLFALYNLFFLQGIYAINTFTIVAGSFLVIFFSSCYWYYLVTAGEFPSLFKMPQFWIVAGAFLCHLGIFAYYISTYAMSAAQMKEWLSILRLVVWSNTLMYSFYLTAFLCTRNYSR